MPTIGSASFALLGATNPTGQSGTIAPGAFNGTFTVTNWATGSISLTAALAFSGFTYNLSGSASFTPGSPAFTGSTSVAVAGSAPIGYACTLSCSALINGAFFGAGAAYAGYAFLVSGASNNSVTGAATFKK